MSDVTQEEFTKNEKKVNNFVISSTQDTILLGSQISSSTAYLMGWILGKCLCLSIPIKAKLSKLLLGLAAGLTLNLADVKSYDFQFA